MTTRRLQGANMSTKNRDLLFAALVVAGYVMLYFQFMGSFGTWLILGALVAMVVTHVGSPSDQDEIKEVVDPPVVRALFGTTQYSTLWLALRWFVGLQWLDAGFHKLQDPAWMQTGEALQGFWVRIVAIPETGRPAITYDWYRSFIQFMLDTGSYTWFAKVIAFGEFAIGVGMIIGLFVGFAAFFGAFMNMNFMLAGSASTNPVLFMLAILIMIAWKTAGYYGADRWVLPMVGTPWSPGPLFNRK